MWAGPRLDCDGPGRNLPSMKASLNEPKARALENTSTAPAVALANHVSPDDGVDVWLLDDSLAATPSERMQANDDALQFADSLRAAMEKRNAKSQ